MRRGGRRGRCAMDKSGNKPVQELLERIGDDGGPRKRRENDGEGVEGAVKECRRHDGGYYTRMSVEKSAVARNSCSQSPPATQSESTLTAVQLR